MLVLSLLFFAVITLVSSISLNESDVSILLSGNDVSSINILKAIYDPQSTNSIYILGSKDDIAQIELFSIKSNEIILYGNWSIMGVTCQFTDGFASNNSLAVIGYCSTPTQASFAFLALQYGIVNGYLYPSVSLFQADTKSSNFLYEVVWMSSDSNTWIMAGETADFTSSLYLNINGTLNPVHEVGTPSSLISGVISDMLVLEGQSGEILIVGYVTSNEMFPEYLLLTDSTQIGYICSFDVVDGSCKNAVPIDISAYVQVQSICELDGMLYITGFSFITQGADNSPIDSETKYGWIAKYNATDLQNIWFNDQISIDSNLPFDISIQRLTGIVVIVGYTYTVGYPSATNYNGFINGYDSAGNSVFSILVPNTKLSSIQISPDETEAIIGDEYQGNLYKLDLSPLLSSVLNQTSNTASTTSNTVSTSKLIHSSSSVPSMSKNLTSISFSNLKSVPVTSYSNFVSTSAALVTTYSNFVSTTPVSDSLNEQPLYFSENLNTQSNQSIASIQNSSLNLFGFSLKYLVILICVVVVVLGLLICAWMLCSKHKKIGSTSKKNSKSSLNISNIFIRTETGVSSSVMNTANSGITITSTMNTQVQTEMGLSIPGFLKYNEGSNFTIEKQVAVGGSANVFTGKAKSIAGISSNTCIIVKKFDDFERDEVRRSLFLQEIALLENLKHHDNIAKILGYSENPYCILMKYYSLGSLHEFVFYKKMKRSKLIACSFMQDICEGIMFMHGKGIVHSDIKPQNILLDLDEENRMKCVITDFGICDILNEQLLLVKQFKRSKVFGASLVYAAPEVFNSDITAAIDGKIGFKRDVYAMSISCYELVVGQKAYR